MINTIKEHLRNLIGCVTFNYNGYSCGIDPLASDDFDIWCGDSSKKAYSIDGVMQSKIFNGKTLADIINDVTDLEY